MKGLKEIADKNVEYLSKKSELRLWYQVDERGYVSELKSREDCQFCPECDFDNNPKNYRWFCKRTGREIENLEQIEPGCPLPKANVFFGITRKREHCHHLCYRPYSEPPFKGYCTKERLELERLWKDCDNSCKGENRATVMIHEDRFEEGGGNGGK